MKMKGDIWHVKNICVAKSERVMKICPPHEDVQVICENYRSLHGNWIECFFSNLGWYMGALVHKDQNKKLLTKETKINDEFNSPNTEKWIHEYEIDIYPEGNTSNWNK